MFEKGKGTGYGVSEWIKSKTLRCFTEKEKAHDDWLIKKIDRSEVEGNRRRGRQIA